ncbi:hypothetical protein Q8A67_016976 [Cirrhinus molitorella]|uniref:Uncharacterized protein n=1 Tax=Cirrhinus molitorella TaxID=172907 RepID=A0AA88PHP7_9TELE|nr:hypothetical protein Q8A67_016976 [Cirrhinus molitorella]
MRYPEATLYACDDRENATIETKRECILKGLCIYLNEDPQDLVREYLDVEPASNEADIKNVLGICVVKHEFADATEDPEDIGIVLECVEMLSGLGSKTQVYSTDSKGKYQSLVLSPVTCLVIISADITILPLPIPNDPPT